MSTYNIPNRQEQGGNRWAVGDGGELDIESGGALKLDGTTITATAAEINTLDTSTAGAGIKVAVLPIAADFDNTEQDTGFDLPAKSVVLDVLVDVTTADAGETLDVGLLSTESGGDANGFLAAVSVASPAVVRGVATVTTGSTEVYFASTTRGALLASLTAGADVAGDVGTYYEFPHITGTAVSVSYTGSNGTTNTMRGSIIIIYLEIA